MIKQSMKIFDLTNKTIILTGSAGMLGTQYSHILSEAGANVVLVDVDNKKNAKLEKDLIELYKTKPSSYCVDITNQNSIKNLVKSVVSKYKKIYGLINNASFTPQMSTLHTAKKFEYLPLNIWNKTIDTNLTAVFLLSQEVGQNMVKNHEGVIVNIASIYGLVGADQRIYGDSNLNSPASYAATKSAVINLTRYLAAYWHKKNIRVNSISLGGVYEKNIHKKNFVKKYSERTMLGRMAKPEEYNGAILFLMSEASSYMTGSNLVIDGGWTAW